MNEKKLWMQHSLAIIILVIFAGGVAVSYFADQPNPLLMTMVGSTISMAAAVVQFYFGSSSGSREKDQVIANQVRNSGSDQPPIAVAINNPTEQKSPAPPRTIISPSS